MYPEPYVSLYLFYPSTFHTHSFVHVWPPQISKMVPTLSDTCNFVFRFILKIVKSEVWKSYLRIRSLLLLLSKLYGPFLVFSERCLRYPLRTRQSLRDCFPFARNGALLLYNVHDDSCWRFMVDNDFFLLILWWVFPDERSLTEFLVAQTPVLFPLHK